jgi:RsiW-degrading membrane proteinase PrsW (M82 family)
LDTHTPEPEQPVEAPQTEESLPCCVCGVPVSPPYNLAGGRVYCARHFAALDSANQGFWRSALVQIVGMALYSLVVALLVYLLGEVDRPWLVPLGVLLVVLPTALWLYYFYRQDRLEPEPKSRIMQVFVLSLLLTEAAGIPFVYDWFGVRDWASADTTTSLLASLLIAGFVWQGINYLSVRWLVYATPEFDERMDGIIYGTISGLGVATAINLHYVLDNQGVALAPASVYIATTALAQASFGGVMGHFMALAKFEHRPVWWVPVGVAVAAALNGLFSWLLGEVSADGLTVEPWRSLALGIVVALVTFMLLLFLMRNSARATLGRTGGE